VIITALVLWALLLLIALFVWYVRYVEPYRFEVTRLELRFPDLPAGLDGLTITHLSDFHCQPTGGSRRTSREAVRLAREAGSDLVLITGDLLDGYDLLEVSGAQLEGLSAPLGVFAVLGNHDHYCFYASPWRRTPPPPLAQIKAGFAARGIELLSNESRILERDGARLAVAGVDDVASGNDDLQATLSGVASADLVVLLSHSPDVLDYPQADRADLILCGHTHGGQLRLPGLGSPWAPVWRDRRRSSGLMRAGQALCYVNRGVASATQARWNCRPEVAVLTLRRGLMPPVREVPVRRPRVATTVPIEEVTS